MNRFCWPIGLVLVGAISLLSTRAVAHWCDDNWASAYNVVVRPQTDVVDVPEQGSAELRAFVQNNLTYPLYDFELSAQAPHFDISVSTAVAKRAGWLMPGEKLLHIFTLTRTGSSSSLDVEQLEFFVTFGNSDMTQYGRYGEGTGRDVMVKKSSGELWPSRPVSSLPELNIDQGLHLRASAVADYGDFEAGVDMLFKDLCTGSLAWDGSSVNISSCPDQNTTSCPSSQEWSNAPGPYSYLYQHLLSAGELAYRMASLSSNQQNLLRERVMCAAQDPSLSIKAYLLFILGYIGPDATAQSYLEDIRDNGDTNTSAADQPAVQAMARAALLAMGQSQYEAEVRSCLNSGNDFAEMACAAALGLQLDDDQAVEDELFARIEWTIFEDNHSGVMSGEYINLLAWRQRGWLPNAGDTGAVSYYEEVVADTTPPAAPVNISHAVVGDNVRVTWEAVTRDENGGPETVGTYTVYWGQVARPGGATAPGVGGFDYAHHQTVSATWFEPAGLTAGETYYFAVTAADLRNNESDYSMEASCVAPVVARAPTAVLTCSPVSGPAPLTVNCHGDDSSDPNGNNTITSRVFTVEGSDYTGPTLLHRFATAGNYTVLLTISDDTSLTDSDSVNISVDDPTGQNTAPTAQATSDVSSGYLPLVVQFDSSGSADSDGSIVSRSWDFDDGSTSTEANPSHTFTDAGQYLVELTVTDDGSPALRGTDLVTIQVQENQPPVLTSASATPLSGAAPLEVHFDATGIYDPQSDPFTMTWDFGDGASASDSDIHHTYATPGSYAAQLSATDGPGASDSRQFTIVVTDPAVTNTPPDISSATVTPVTGQAPLEVTLDASSCSDPDGDELSYQWFVDETPLSQQPTVDHSFAEPGEYTATLRVTDNGSPALQSSTSFEIFVELTTNKNNQDLGAGCNCSMHDLSEQCCWPVLLALVVLSLFRRHRREYSASDRSYRRSQ